MLSYFGIDEPLVFSDLLFSDLSENLRKFIMYDRILKKVGNNFGNLLMNLCPEVLEFKLKLFII